MSAPHPEPTNRREVWVKRLAVVATVGMFIVLMMGSTVTNTGSGEGCGRSWPLCHGKFIPEYAVETAIEYSHRLVTGIEGLLIAATAVGALLIRRGDRAVKFFVAVMIGTLIVQSGLGAAAVMWPQTPQVMALHFGISMTCFAAIFLLTRKLYERPGEDHPVTAMARMHPLPRWFHIGVWGTLVGSIGVAYIGAYMRHAGYDLACHTWPSCNGALVPDLTSPAGIAFSHRFTALLLMLLVYALTAYLYVVRERYPSLFTMLGIASVLITIQALVGGAVVLSRLDLWTTLAHAAFMALLFVAITDSCRQALKARQGSIRPSALYAPQPVGSSTGD
jgi:cytochrome c oxidase assembly protein subunit 15